MEKELEELLNKEVETNCEITTSDGQFIPKGTLGKIIGILKKERMAWVYLSDRLKITIPIENLTINN
jgi:hypothetical protein